MYDTSNNILYSYCNETAPVPNMGVIKRTVNPTTTGTSVLGVKFNKGVLITADVGGYFGSLARFKKIDRVTEINKNIVLGSGGDIADFSYMLDVIKQKIIDETCMDDGFLLKPKSLYCWLTRILYNKRSNFNPLWTNFIVGGIQDGEPFLGTVDKLGTAYEDDCIATGYGSYIAVPMLRAALEQKKDLTEQEAKDLISKCMQVLFYRDARSYPSYKIATITEEGVSISDPLEVETNWETAFGNCQYE